MPVITLEGIVEQGQIRLKTELRVPDHTRVFVVIPDAQWEPLARIITPRLADPEQSRDFLMEIVK